MCWNRSYLPISVKGIWLYLRLAIDIQSHRVVAWDVAEKDDGRIAGARGSWQGPPLAQPVGNQRSAEVIWIEEKRLDVNLAAHPYLGC